MHLALSICTLLLSTAAPAVVTVSIDVVPQKINPRARGVIPVVVLTTPAFDAATVDAASVRFGPGNTRDIHSEAHLKDHDGDGDKDALFHFAAPPALIPCNATSVSLTGQTREGTLISGFDAIQVVGCR